MTLFSCNTRGDRPPHLYSPELNCSRKLALCALSLITLVAGAALAFLASQGFFGPVGSPGFYLAASNSFVSVILSFFIFKKGLEKSSIEKPGLKELRNHQFTQEPKIRKFTHYTSLPNEVAIQILTNLTFHDLLKSLETERRFAESAKAAFVQKAQMLGYDGAEFVEAKHYIKSLFECAYKILSSLEKYKAFPGDLRTSDGIEACLSHLHHLSYEEVYAICLTVIPKKEDGYKSLIKYLRILFVDGDIPGVAGETIACPQDWHKWDKRAHLDLIRLLVHIGMDLNSEDRWKRCPLHYAATYVESDLVSYLLARGASTNACDIYGRSALSYASKPIFFERYFADPANQERVYQTTAHLLTHGANPNVELRDKKRPLHQMAEEQCITTVDLLLHYEAEINCFDCNGHTPLYYLISRALKEEEIVKSVKKMIERGADCNLEHNLDTTPLQIAFHKGYSQIVSLLWDLDLTVNQAKKSGQRLSFKPPADWLRDTTLKNLFEVILQKGVHPDNLFIDELPLLFWASAYHHHETVALLLQFGAKTDCVIQGKGIVHYLFCHEAGYEFSISPTLKVLIEKGGIDPNGSDAEIVPSPLILALKKYFFSIAAYLIEHEKVDVNKAAHDGTTPLYVAAHMHLHDLVEKLIKKGAKEKAPAHKGVIMGVLENRRMSEEQRLVMIQFLHAEGCVDLNAPADGNTPLVLSLRENLINIASYLIDQGAAVNQANGEGETPLLTLTKSSTIDPKTKKELLKKLILKGADVNLSLNEKTPLDWAIELHYPNFAKHLRAAGARQTVTT